MVTQQLGERIEDAFTQLSAALPGFITSGRHEKQRTV
jgi:hypothetical protein